jgi:DinB superfamily
MTNFKELVHTYLAGAATLRTAVAGMTREQIVARPVAGRWSTLECVAHVADFEPILAERMKRILSLDRPLLLVADENLFLSALSYHDRDIEEELAVVDLTRKQMSRILLSLPAESASRVGIHSYKGLVTLEAVLNSAINHVPHHVKYIEEKRRLLGC